MSKRSAEPDLQTEPAPKESKNEHPAAAPVPRRCKVLHYTYVEGILEKRAPHRAGHLKLWTAAAERGELLLGGALDPPTAAFLMLTDVETAAVKNLAKDDPYVVNELVPSYDIKDWNVVIECSGSSVPASEPPSAVPVPTKCLLLRYTYVEDVLAKRGPHRAGHLALWKALADRGQLLLGGALDPPAAGYIVLRGIERQDAEKIIAEDPYVTNDLVLSHTLEDWNVVVGSLV